MGGSGEQYAILSAIYIEGGLAFFSLLVGWFFGFSPIRTIEWNLYPVVWGVGATIPLLSLYVVLDRLPIAAFRKIRRLVKTFVRFFFRRCSFLQIVLICTLAGLGEEMFFRGLLQDGLGTWIGGTTGIVVGILVSALIFGLAHWITNTYAVLTFFMGLYFSLLFLATGNLLAPIIAHALYDYYVIRFLLLRSRKRRSRIG